MHNRNIAPILHSPVQGSVVLCPGEWESEVCCTWGFESKSTLVGGNEGGCKCHSFS